MDFYTLLDRVVDLLRQHQRVTYRALQRQFDLDEVTLNDLKDELLYAQQVARDEVGRVLVWTDPPEAIPAPGPTASQPVPPPMPQDISPLAATPGVIAPGRVSDVHLGLVTLHDLVGVTAGAKPRNAYHIAILLQQASAWHGEWESAHLKHDRLAFAAMALWLLGYPDQAINRSRAAFSLAQELAHPFSLAWALLHAAWLHQWRGEAQASQEWAEAGIALSTEQGFSYWLAVGTVQRGWALAEQGQAAEGIAQISQGIAAYRAIGAELVSAHFLGLLAEAHGKARQAAEGLAAVAEALAVLYKTGERWWEAELYRLKGELLRMQGEAEVEVEACFHQARAIARRQEAKSLELRTATSLSRLWQQQGKRTEAHDLLAPIYSWFTEGFNTADLQEAKALLDVLA